MCLLSYFPPGVMPDLDKLKNGAEINRDGFGWAIVTRRDSLLIRRDMQPDRAMESFLRAREANPEGPAIFHSRYGTSGTKTLLNCHPFDVGSDHRTVFAHNGVLFATKGDPRCDTRVFAEEAIPQKYRRLDNQERLNDLAAALKTGKGVILTVNHRYRHPAYLLNFHLGTWLDDGSWQSNSSWRGRNRRYMKEIWAVCKSCGKDDAVSPFSNRCRHCAICALCEGPWAKCKCPAYPSRTQPSGQPLALPPAG